jgi:hypothetical protein
MNWPLAVVIVALLFFGYCAYSADQATEMMDRATDEAALYQRCYGAGYDAAIYGEDNTPPKDGEKCADWFEAGFSDGRRVSGGVRWDLSGLVDE